MARDTAERIYADDHKTRTELMGKSIWQPYGLRNTRGELVATSLYYSEAMDWTEGGAQYTLCIAVDNPGGYADYIPVEGA